MYVCYISRMNTKSSSGMLCYIDILAVVHNLLRSPSPSFLEGESAWAENVNGQGGGEGLIQHGHSQVRRSQRTSLCASRARLI